MLRVRQGRGNNLMPSGKCSRTTRGPDRTSVTTWLTPKSGSVALCPVPGCAMDDRAGLDAIVNGGLAER